MAQSKKEESRDYVRVEVIAKIFGVTVRRVQQLTQEGIIQTEEVKENGRKQRRYDLIPTVMKYISYLSDKAYGKSAPSDKEVELKLQKLEADVALRESQGELHRIKTAIASGDYISIEEIKLDYAKFFVVFKKFAMSLPSRVGSILSEIVDPLEQRRIEKEMSGEIAALLNSFVVAAVAHPKEVKKILDGKNAEVEKKV